MNLADAFDTIAATVPNRRCLGTWPATADPTAVIWRTWAQTQARVHALAAAFVDAGVGPGDRVAILGTNGHEWLETMFAAFCCRAVPCNVNYRYVHDELAYVLGDIDPAVVVTESTYAARVAPLRNALSALRCELTWDPAAGIDDGDSDFEAAIAAHLGRIVDPARCDDDRYLLYTGGTTGMPKGVEWRVDDFFYGALAGALGRPAPRSRADLAAQARDSTAIGHPAPPYMHGTAHWFACWVLFDGGSVVDVRGEGFDAARFWRICDTEGVTHAAIVGDPFAKPLLDAAEADDPDGRTGVGASLRFVLSGGAVLAPATKRRWQARWPDVLLADGLGTSESGGIGRADSDGSFRVGRSVKVMAETRDRFLEPGDPAAGLLAKSGRIPLGYRNDPEKTAATFVELDGRRWVVAGDHARVRADGGIELLGRGSQSINTGGEKVYPEEVEAVLAGHPGIADVVVVGVPDERWGNAVTAVVAPAHGWHDRLDLAALRQRLDGRLARYKWPKHLVCVPAVRRSPAGKPDYAWALAEAIDRLPGAGPGMPGRDAH